MREEKSCDAVMPAFFHSFYLIFYSIEGKSRARVIYKRQSSHATVPPSSTGKISEGNLFGLERCDTAVFVHSTQFCGVLALSSVFCSGGNMSGVVRSVIGTWDQYKEKCRHDALPSFL